jgi:hypothetical protein
MFECGNICVGCMKRHQPLVTIVKSATKKKDLSDAVSRRSTTKSIFSKRSCYYKHSKAESLKTPFRRRVIPQPLFSQPSDEAFFNVVTRRSPCSDLEEFVSRNLSASPPTGPALLVPFLDLSSTVSTLELRCESLVANISCARGTLQVRELCIKAVRKAKRV